MRRSILYAIVAVVVVVIIVSAVFLYRPPSATSPSSAPSTQSAATPTTTYLTVTTTISGTVTTTVVPYVIYPSNVVVFYSWWAGLERYGINAVVSAFENATGMQVENIQIPGTSSLYGLIISSLSAGLPPPPTFQQPTDPVQLVFIKLLPPNKWANYTEDAIKFGFLNNYTLPGIFGGVWVNVVNRTLYFPGLPSDMQTNSLIFYNRKLLETVEGGKITWIPVTTSQFLQLMQMAAEKGVPGLCQGGSDIWTFGYVFNDYLIEHGGVYEWYKAGYGLMDPNNATDYNIVEGAVLYVVNLSKYLSPDWSSADWTTCVADVAAGKVLAHEDGDWVLGVLQAGMNVSTCWYTNITPACQVVVAPQPGTFGYIIQSSDMLWTVNTGNSQQLQNQMKFVEFVAGKQGQSIFCPIKGCVAVYPNEPLSVYKYPASVGEQEYWYYVEARKGLSHVLINLDQSVFYGSIAGLPNPPSDIYVTVPQLVSQGILPNGSYNWPLINKYIQMVFWLQNQRKQFFQGWYMGLPGMPAGGFWPPWAQGTWAQAAAPPPITPVYITVISVPQELPTTPSYSS